MKDLEKVLARLREEESHYNPELRLLRAAFHSPGYHTTLTKDKYPYVHNTRESLDYAFRLLESENQDYRQRALDIIERIISLQETDPGKPTYGIWSWFYEEPLEKMSPPDWNWADFLGKTLLKILYGHESRLPSELAERVRESVCRACDAIIKRNVGPGYTNIAIMGALVTILAGELLAREDYLQYGVRRLEIFNEYTGRTNSFEEYNSPTYTALALVELTDLDRLANHPGVKELSSKLLELGWRSIAMHYHPATGQWAGPHSRCYGTLLNGFPLEFLNKSADVLNRYKDIYEGQHRREFSETVKLHPKGFRIESHTCLDDRLALGTFDREVMWNQRRNLVAYTSNGGKPGYVHLRFLKDGYDFSSAAFLSKQEGLKVLFGIAFATNGGDRTPVLDMIQGRFEAFDLRLRLEIGGSLEGVVRPEFAGNGHWTVDLDGVLMKLVCGLGAFDRVNPAGAWEVVETPEQICLDFVFYKGDRREFILEDLVQAYFTAGLEFGDAGTPCEELASHSETNGSIAITWNGLQLTVPVRPMLLDDIYMLREQS